ncbi:class I SAM-dependent methyltransferase [Planctomonas sp. JC2975]|uniref:class I SAM-dependent methyltransferase n=1 Tax=Planctomonas sp. JC2975 TaxID=2729626 RepID=UPI0014732EF1|nr:class I SAM-dependent methyltransferase [Planctomonas sp. JC2975]NNC12162.1 class I SAM-dependent methyltransferase [Planctomonas sp. JC2975]
MIELPHLSPVERSALLTVISRARDAEGRDPILADEWSVLVRDALAADWNGLGMPRKEAYTVATRGRLLDDLCRDFLRLNPDAVVIELGSGLDDRAERVDPPDTATWIDLDLPGIQYLRRQLPARRVVAAHRLELPADVTKDDWMRAVPRNRPVAIVADGFFPFLTPEESADVVRGIVDRAPAGELLMNGYTTLARTLMPRVRAIRDLGIDVTQGTAFDDPREPERWHPRLKLAQRIMLTRSPYVIHFSPALRATIRTMDWLPSLSDRSDLGVLRFVY